MKKQWINKLLGILLLIIFTNGCNLLATDDDGPIAKINITNSSEYVVKVKAFSDTHKGDHVEGSSMTEIKKDEKKVLTIDLSKLRDIGINDSEGDLMIKVNYKEVDEDKEFFIGRFRILDTGKYWIEPDPTFFVKLKKNFHIEVSNK